MSRYVYLEKFHKVFESCGLRNDEPLNCCELAGKPFTFRRLVPKDANGPEDPSTDMHVCYFEHLDCEVACWAEEVVSSINGVELAVRIDKQIRRIGDRV